MNILPPNTMPGYTRSLSLFLLFGTLLVPMASASPMGVAAEGLIIPGEGIIHVSPASMGVVAELHAAVGDTVAAGQKLARMQDYALAQAAAAVASAQVATVRARKSTLAAEQAAANSALAAAEAGLAEVRAARGSKLAEHASGTARIQRKIAAMQDVIAEKSPPRREREEIEFEITLLEIELENHDALLPNMRSVLDAQTKRAEAEIEVARVRQLAAAAAKDSWQGELAVAEAEVERAQTAVAMAIVRAPADATILAIHAQPGEAVGPLGLLSLGDLQNMYVEAEVYVDDLHRLQTGQAAVIEGPALPQSLQGQVERIGLVVGPANLRHRDPAILSDRQVVGVRVRLDQAPGVPVHTQVTVRIPADAQ